MLCVDWRAALIPAALFPLLAPKWRQRVSLGHPLSGAPCAGRQRPLWVSVAHCGLLHDARGLGSVVVSGGSRSKKKNEEARMLSMFDYVGLSKWLHVFIEGYTEEQHLTNNTRKRRWCLDQNGLLIIARATHLAAKLYTCLLTKATLKLTTQYTKGIAKLAQKTRIY